MDVSLYSDKREREIATLISSFCHICSPFVQSTDLLSQCIEGSEIRIPNATTFASIAMIGIYSLTLSINTNNTIVVINSDEIFADDGSYKEGRVARWISNGTRLSSFIRFSDCSRCDGLFIDINNNFYCSQQNLHQVARKSVDHPSSPLSIVAGVGLEGSYAYMLGSPIGIFVTTPLDLYVADCYNNRVQLFRSGENNATTVSTGAFLLHYPSGVALDGDRYLFIVDQYNHRVIGSGPGGYQCVVGCSGSYGSASDQLYYPSAMSFDSTGNIFVTDYYNHRIQKFSLIHAVNEGIG